MSTATGTLLGAVTRPRLGFLGVGWIGRHRLEALVQHTQFEIAAIADAAPEMARQAAALVPTAALAGSLDELLDADLDGLVIATPSALHAAQAITALEHGLHVFCQKPLGRHTAETRRVVDAARAARRLLSVDFCYRFMTGMQRIYELIHSGALGQVYAAELVFHNAYGPDKPWFYDRRLAGGGCAMDLGIHLVDLALWTLDFPALTGVSSQLYAHGRPLSFQQLHEENLVEDYATALLSFDNGATAQLACSWRLPAGSDALIRAAFYGTEGGAVLRNVNGSFYDFVAEHLHGTTRTTLSAPPDDWGGRAIIAWAERIAAGTGFDNEAAHLINVASTLDAIYGFQES